MINAPIISLLKTYFTCERLTKSSASVHLLQFWFYCLICWYSCRSTCYFGKKTSSVARKKTHQREIISSVHLIWYSEQQVQSTDDFPSFYRKVCTSIRKWFQINEIVRLHSGVNETVLHFIWMWTNVHQTVVSNKVNMKST